jgi:DNA-binding PadR family transcriptional regulator
MPPKTKNIPEHLRELLPLSPAVFFVMFALADGEKHGYAIMQEVLTLSENRVRMGAGTLYTTIQRLLNMTIIEETTGSGNVSDHEARRRYYRLAPNGKILLEAEISRMESVVRRARRKKLTPRTAE